MQERFKGRPFGSVQVYPGRLTMPFRWRKPRVAFCSTFDPFHEDIPESYIREALSVARQCDRHQYLWLTKRSKRMREIMAEVDPPKTLWLGITAENCDCGNERVRDLLRTPAAHRWISAEPLLEDLTSMDLAGIDWLVVGCESGPKRRPCNGDWIRGILSDCREWRVPCLVKQIDLGGRCSADPSEWSSDLRVQQFPEGLPHACT